MPRVAGSKNFFNFVGGMNTDSSPLASPEGTARLLKNVDLEVTGEIQRRLGLDFESGFVFSTDTFTEVDTQNKYISLDEWTSANDDLTDNFYVVRVGLKLYFFDMVSSNPSATLRGTVTLTGNTDTTTILQREDIQFTTGKGVLFATGRTLKPSYITFDGTSTFTQVIIDMEIRDFEGVDDGLVLEDRPSALSVLHQYNLKNQGWITTNYDLVKAGLSVFPSNSDIQVLGKDSLDVFTAALLDKQFFGNSQAPRGHFIIDAFDDDRAAVSGIALGTDSTVVKRPLSSTFYSSRIWYAGPNGRVLFSPILETLSKAGKCFQEQDPTAEEFNELLATDGGVISIPEMGDALQLESVANGVLAFSPSGVWHISGGVENFSAINFQVQQITNIGLSGSRSVVRAEDRLYYWADGGIYLLAVEEISGAFQATNISEGVIRRDFSHISQAAKITTIGTYDRESKLIYWAYNRDQPIGTTTNESDFDTILIYNISLNAFYTYSISNITDGGITSFIGGLRKSTARALGSGASNVTVGGEIVTIGGANITITEDFQDASVLGLKVLMFSPQSGVFKFTLGDFSSRSFFDWKTQDSTGVDYSSVIETGYGTLGDAMRDKQATHLFTFLSRGRAAIDTDNIFTGT